MNLNKRLGGFIIILFVIFIPAYGQFYNGHQMEFGKNRVQYNNFYWSFYRFDRFDTYFNEYGKGFAQFTAKVAESELKRIEEFFDYRLEKRLIFCVFNKLTDYRQSNIGLVSGTDKYNIGGTTRILNNKIFISYEGDHENFKKQISKAICELIVNEMLYGNTLRNNITNSTLINLPGWYLNGLFSYIASDWNIDVENKVKDGIINGKYEKFNRLSGQDAIIAGHSFWRYIGKTYGTSVIPNILYLTRVNKNANTGFLYVLGKNVKELSYEWLAYYVESFSKYEQNKQEFKYKPVNKKRSKTTVYNQVKNDPEGKYIAYVSNDMGKYKIWLYNKETGKKTKIFKRGHKLEQIIDYSYPVLAWHPTGRILSFITEEKGRLILYYYIIETGELESRHLLYFEKILDFDFSDDATKLVVSAVKESKTDIFIYSLISSTHQRITNDLADDLSPRFINNSNGIIFTSNRVGDTINLDNENEKDVSQNMDMFIYDFNSKSNILTRLGDKNYFNESLPSEFKKNKYLFLSDKNGIRNRYMAEFDSTISHVDTSIHYRYLIHDKPITNYPRNIVEYDYNQENKELSEIIYHDGRYHLYNHPLDLDEYDELEKTDFRKEHTLQLAQEDSINSIEKKVVNLGSLEVKEVVVPGKNDTIYFNQEQVDINNYIFEKEKVAYYNDKYKNDNIRFRLDTVAQSWPKIRIYETSFYPNYLVTQVDFSFLNSSYQAFTGGAVYYNPGLNMFFKLGTNDLFEDYKLIGGVRFSANFDSNEYLLSFENLKKRIDKQWIFHRQAFKNIVVDEATYLVKTHSHQLMYISKYPFSQVASVRGTISLRHDKSTYLSTDVLSLNKNDFHKIWSGVKLEYVFDNTRDLGINLYDGSRFKIFGEAYKQVNQLKNNLFVLGCDFRHYLKIHRNLIWASRFAASSSLGSSKLIYYLGSVDNWITLFNPDVFDYSVPINNRENYAYQTLATNMRGFVQNIRNGNNFAVINTEIRWPFISYIANYPISSSFWSNMQLVGFFDIGSAWTGWTPFSGKNAYDNEIVNNPPITVILDANRYPIVAGYGFGVRTQLFGYFVRLDWAWGIENGYVLPKRSYFSLSLDF